MSRNFIDRLDATWDRWAQIPHSTLRRYMWINMALFGAFVAFILFVYKPFPTICYLKPGGWFMEPAAPFYFWLPGIWFFAAAIHFFVVSSLTVDEDWAVAKSREMRAKSVDFSHMSSIMDRQWDGDDSVTSPVDPRRKSDPFGKPLKSKSKPKSQPTSETSESNDKSDKT